MILVRELALEEPEDYRNYLRMNSESFSQLLEMIIPRIEKQWTNIRNPILPQERLVATLRFLVTGCSYEDLKFIM